MTQAHVGAEHTGSPLHIPYCSDKIALFFIAAVFFQAIGKIHVPGKSRIKDTGRARPVGPWSATGEKIRVKGRTIRADFDQGG